MRRFVALLFLLLCVSAAPRALAAAPADSGSLMPPVAGTTVPVAPTTTIDNTFLDTKRDLSECLNHSVDLPDCGIQPTQPGDRGGWLQGATFLVMTAGIVVICWRVYRSVKVRDRQLAPKTGA